MRQRKYRLDPFLPIAHSLDKSLCKKLTVILRTAHDLKDNGHFKINQGRILSFFRSDQSLVFRDLCQALHATLSIRYPRKFY